MLIGIFSFLSFRSSFRLHKSADTESHIQITSFAVFIGLRIKNTLVTPAVQGLINHTLKFFNFTCFMVKWMSDKNPCFPVPHNSVCLSLKYCMNYSVLGTYYWHNLPLWKVCLRQSKAHSAMTQHKHKRTHSKWQIPFTFPALLNSHIKSSIFCPVFLHQAWRIWILWIHSWLSEKEFLFH